MMVKIMSNSKKIKGKVHFYVSRLAGAVQFCMVRLTMVRGSQQPTKLF